MPVHLRAPRPPGPILVGLIALSSGGLWLLGGPATNESASPAATAPALAIAPATIWLAPGDTSEARVIITNPSGAAVTVNAIETVPAARVDAELVGIKAGVQIKPASTVVANLIITGSASVAETELTVVATVLDGTGNELRLNDSVTVKPTSAEATLFHAAFTSFPDSLNDGDCRVAVLEITNNSTSVLTSVTASPISSDDVSIAVVSKREVGPDDEDSCGGSADIQPLSVADIDRGQTVWLTVEVRAASALRTGTQQVAVAVDATPSSQDDIGSESMGGSPIVSSRQLLQLTTLS